MRARVAASIAVAIAVSVAASSAHAQHGQPAPSAQPAPATRAMSEPALAYFERGSADYAAGNYAAAIDAFERGRQLDPHPDLLYALAQAYRRSGDCPRAISLYQAFLATHPPAREAAVARANFERCPIQPVAEPPPVEPTAPTAVLVPPSAAPVTRPSAPPAPAPPPAPADRWYRDAFGDALLGAGLVAGGVGAGYLITGDRKIRDANDAHSIGQRITDGAAGTHDRQIGTWTAASGGALVVAAIVRYAVRSEPSDGPTIALTFHSASLGWSSRF